jgi:hypothetical protein
MLALVDKKTVDTIFKMFYDLAHYPREETDEDEESGYVSRLQV